MTSLEAILKSHSMKKAAVSKLRKQVENKLKAAVSKKRRSLSGLVALEKKKEDLTRAKDHAIQLLNQHLSQKASIERLKIAAEGRLQQEQDAKDQATQQSEYGSEDKNTIAERLKYIGEKIAELHSELKERESVHTRLEKAIESSEKEKAKVEDQLKKQGHVKPALIEQLKASTKEEAVLRPKFESLLKLEAQASNALATVQKKLAEIAAQRRKRLAVLAAKKRKRMAALAAQRRKNKARQLALAKARKAKARKTKRRPSKKTAKRKSGSKKAPRRKVAKTAKRKTTRTAKRKTTKKKSRRR
jgi:chromosome segregation ATPase